uniref:Alpha-amylase n=1 Tax=Culicoides sonorensis TaxID=179676 RepID=A0A336LMX9_CULSO
MSWIIKGVLITLACAIVHAQYDPHYVPGREVMVHLMDWKFADIADECERFLGPKGYGGIQLSPVSENQIVLPPRPNRPWWERYQPMSYKIHTRSGTEEDFLDMSRRCNKVGVRLYPDVILNHMSATGNDDIVVGTAGSTAKPGERDFPAVPYTQNDFNQPKCEIRNWGDPKEIRNCNLVGLEDLDQSKDWVREKLIEHLNHLIDLGVAGFRIDAAKHMWPQDLEYIFNNLKDLNTEFGFERGARAFIFQEVIDYGGDVIKRQEYQGFGPVTDFIFSRELSRAFSGGNNLKWLKTFGPEWGLLESKYSFCFVDNHDNQRDDGGILTFKRPKQYKMAQAFALAHPHGHRRIMSSFNFNDREEGPPQDDQQNIISPVIQNDGSCSQEWVCEHRWRQIMNMVDFRNVVSGTDIENWWDNDYNQIAFSRGDKGFVVFNGQNDNLSATINTGLPLGRYCDVISGQREGNSCTGIEIVVTENGFARIDLPSFADDGVIAIHVGSNSRIQDT